MGNAEWTVLVYMAGDNNISNRCVDNIRQMQQVGSTNAVNILVQFDPKKQGAKTKRYRIKRQEADGTFGQDVVYTFPGETNTGDPRVLEEFLRWGVDQNPNSRLLVILWGHGNGMDDDKPTATEKNTLTLSIKSDALIRSVANSEFKVATAVGDDENPQDFLSTNELKNVFERISGDLKHKVDIVGFDSCLMSMAEVYDQLSHTVRYAVGSEGVTPSSSWPYHRILTALKDNPSMQVEDLACLIVDRYIAYYSDHDDVTVDLSVCDLDLGGTLASLVGELAVVLNQNLSPQSAPSVRLEIRNALHFAHFFAQSYYGDAYVDIFDLCQLLHESCQQQRVRIACENLMGLLDQKNRKFVVISRFTGEDSHPYGLSIYFPWNVVNDVYRRLDFPRRTGWLEFLDTYTGMTPPDRIR